MRNRYHNYLAALFCGAVLLLAETTANCSPEASNIRQISYGLRHFCAVTTTAEAVCWGDNTMGQIGNGKYSRSLPDGRVLDPTLIIPMGVTAVSAGSYHTCAIASGMLYCWGSNTSGEIGIGRIDPDAYKVLTAKPVMVLSRDVNAVSAGGGHTCAIVGEDLQCWGANWSGQIGTGSLMGNTSKPLTIIKGGVSAVSAGEGHTCAVVRGDLWCWGDNRGGQIGSGATSQNVLSPVKIISGGVSAVAAGNGNTCAIVKGALLCWGANANSQLDTDTSGNVLAPKQFIPGGVTAVAMRHGSFCAVVRGALQCWGYVGTNGDLGIATSDYKMRINHPQELIPGGVTAVGMGERGTGVVVNGALRFRGWDAYLDDTVQKWQFAPFSEAQRDIAVLSHAGSDKLIAQTTAPAKIAAYLASHRIIYQNGVVYYLSSASAGLLAPFQPRDEPSLHLSLIAIPLFQSTMPAGPLSKQNGNAVTLAPGAACGLDEGRAHTLDSPLFYIQAGDGFTNLQDALLPGIPVLPKFDSYRNTLTASAQDMKKIQDCARHVAGVLDSVPYSSVSYALHGGGEVVVPASMAQQWVNEAPGWVNQIYVRDKGSNWHGYSAQAYTVSAMQCGGKVLTKWKHWQSPELTLGKDNTLFRADSALLLANAREFPAYTEAELRRAIRAEQEKEGMASAAEARTCLPAVIGERFEILHQGTTMQRFSIDLPAPQPPLAPDCDQALLCKTLPGTHLRVVALLPSSTGVSQFGDAAPSARSRRRTAAAPDQQDNSGAQDTFGMDDAGVAADTYVKDVSETPATASQPDSYDLALFVVDEDNGEIYNRSLQKRAYVSAPLILKQFSLDTGRYQLAPGTRAFGLRAQYSDPRTLAPQGETTLRLFVRDGNALRRVLDGLVMAAQESRLQGTCGGASTEVSRGIDIGPTASHGYADLIVTSTVKVTENAMSGGRCVEQALPLRTESATLHYDGGEYVIPAALRAAQ